MLKYVMTIIFLCCVLSLNVSAEVFSGYDNYVYNANDFAIEWIDYNPVGMFNEWLEGIALDNPENVLGRPTVDTTGDDWYIPEDMAVPINPTYPAFRYYELLYLGEGGSVTVKFDHHVRDDLNNPYGIDLIVFGNSAQVIGGGTGWGNGDPELLTMSSFGNYQPGIVSVSQDSVTWYSFTNDPNFMSGNPNFIKLVADANDGPFCNSFAPTLGRVYDPCDPDQSIGAWNQYWAEPTNPTLPVDPNLFFDDFGGQSLAYMSGVYGNSAGGTGYDISRLDLPVDPVTGKKWFIYVRVDDKPNGGTTKIDAFSDVSSCGDWKHPFPEGDINHDCIVNMSDCAVLSKYWLKSITGPENPANIANIFSDTVINSDDLDIIADNWLSCSWDCD